MPASCGQSMGRATSLATAADSKALVVDASALVEALLGTDLGVRARGRMRGHVLHAPAHLDAEVLSALGRLFRASKLAESAVGAALKDLTEAPIQRHSLVPLLSGAWERRETHRLVDALYVELTEVLASKILTTDVRLARSAAQAELVSGRE
jgi:predicted nucleic acid-binding protein